MEQKSKVFIALADIKKAFDTVVHKGLFYFLKKLGLKGKIYDSILNNAIKIYPVL